MKPQKNVVKKLIIQPRFDIQMDKILEFGIKQFGSSVTYNFHKTILEKILKLPFMPNMHPKNRFIESTDKKVYRNILVEKYSVLYSVTAHTIQVITIYHQATNPDTIKGFVK